MEKTKNIIVFVMALPGNTADAVREYEEEFGGPVRIMLLTDSRLRGDTETARAKGYDIVESCDFSKPWRIAETFLKYEGEILAVTGRSEKHMSRYMQVIPHVPYSRTPSTESLRWSKDKYEMRKRLRLYNSKLTPKFTWVKKNSKAERDRVVKKIGFPLVVKPSNAASSRYVTICFHEEELESTLRTIFRSLKKIESTEAHLESTKVIAEQYMEGEMYSVDSYVNSRGGVHHCPLVKVTTGKDIGHDDFYNYLQLTPTALKSTTVEKANKAAEDAIHALGLRSTTAHVELMKIDDEWKIIEVGARIGGFRHTLHKLSCGINHSLNDVFIHIPKKPVIPKKCQGYSCAMKWFADKEGTITEVKGIKKIEELDSFVSLANNIKVGGRSVFARNGGTSVFNLIMSNQDRSKLLADIRRVEKLVKIKIADRATVAKKSKKSKK